MCISRGGRTSRKEKHKSEATPSDGANPSSEEQSTPPAPPGGLARAEDMERGFTTVISYTEDEDLDKSPTSCIHIARIIVTLITRGIQYVHSFNLKQNTIVSDSKYQYQDINSTASLGQISTINQQLSSQCFCGYLGEIVWSALKVLAANKN